ncbi:alcohol dehydrogenase catalytic domain-containing protein [Caballeronia jiangsuensis]
MKAVRFHGKHDLRIDDVEEPGELAPDQVLVRPTFCGICGTDLHEFDHGPTWTSVSSNPYSGATLPQILGHEFSGEVLAVGSAVTSVSKGDRVSIQPQIGPREVISGVVTCLSSAPMPPLSV